ncbi:MAG: DUF2807 domain-containing protein [Tannerellaceae bacterium]|nr:DUF2807 domain-containing protein [Tannerellaceae bacterium]
MKKGILFFCVSLCMMAGTCSVHAEKVKGNGSIVTKEVQVSEFKGIEFGPGIEWNDRFFGKKSKNPVFRYSQTEGEAALEITVDENLYPLLLISSSNGTLSIGVKEGKRIIPSRLEISGHSKTLQNVSVSGCGDFVLMNDLKTDDLAITVSGAGDVKLDKPVRVERFKVRVSGAGDLKASDLVCEEIESQVSGSGDVTLKGKAERGVFGVSGAGDMGAFDFIVKELDCSVSGSGDLDVHATGRLNVSVSGAGDIRYKGDAPVQLIKKTGAGDIRQVN